MLQFAAAAVLVLCVSFSAASAGDGGAVTVDWLKDQIKSNQGNIDLGKRCNDTFSPTKTDASDACRVIQASDIVTLLYDSANDTEKIRISGADINGPLDLSGQNLKKELNLEQCIIREPINLRRSHWNNSLIIGGSHVLGAVTTVGMRVDGVLSFAGTTFEKVVDLSEAKFDMKVDLENANFAETLKIIQSSIQGGLYMNGHSTFSKVEINYITVGENLELETSTFNNEVEAEGIIVNGHVFLGKGVFKQPITMTFARIAGELDLAGGTFSRVDLTNATVGQQLGLGAGLETPRKVEPPRWSASLPSAALILRNAHARTFQSRLESAASDPIDDWPSHVDLDGFVYDGLDDHSLEGREDRLGAWEHWLDKNTKTAADAVTPFNPQPYALLAKLLDGQGRGDDANALRYVAREKERLDAAMTGGWLHGRWWLLTALKWLIGYGIGFGAFKVVYWVVASIALGALLLLPARAARDKGLLWCVGASTERLLPIIELNKEFADFFDDPHRRRLRGWQIGFFSVYALWGWFLGLLLVAAMSGLTQAP